MSRRLKVRLHGVAVGQLTEAADGRVELRLLDSYRDTVPRPVLGQKFEDDLERAHRSRRRGGLPDFFANLIPEGRLREVIEQAAGVESGDDLELLSFVGRDLPGAVVVGAVEEATESPPGQPEEEATAEEALASTDALRFSLAGVQLKFSMIRDADKLTLPARDAGGAWIVKIDSPSFPRLPENEYAMLKWAEAAGFEVPECHLHDSSELAGLPGRLAPTGSRLLAVRRYDRSPEGRIHQEDFAQAVGLPPARKYDQITYDAMARLIRRFVDDAAVDELIRRLAFVIACGNNDAHLKNWSLVYPDRVRAEWSPLYDQVATVAWEAPDRALALQLGAVKEFGRLDRAVLERFADRAQVDRRRVLNLVERTLDRLNPSVALGNHALL